MITLEISSKNYADSLLCIKTSLSHMESLLGCYNGYALGEPSSRFGWTFFTLAFKSDLEDAMSSKFSGMMEKYGRAGKEEKFAMFVSDYFSSRGCDARIKAV
ncbi:MAG: hypothetical protein EB829_03730 [Nitrosopumilus sp. H8]|nr:MAG: hypothetical protein EB830_04495 [Nitrosopumilus sp. H13]RNJ78789.1 MAG: hypothetical protein EB829_03730 [Nitrosopumilus sp. H8]